MMTQTGIITVNFVTERHKASDKESLTIVTTFLLRMNTNRAIFGVISKRSSLLKPRGSEMPKMTKVNEKKVRDKSLIANSFCTFFSTIGSSLQQRVLSIGNLIWKPFENENLRKSPLLATQIKFKTVTPPEVEKLLMNLKTSKAANGPDQIPPQNVARCGKGTVHTPMPSRKPKSAARSFPYCGKNSNGYPDFQIRRGTSFDNYRPISVLHSVSKTVEKIACKQLTTFLQSQNLPFKHQYGFRKSK